MYVSNWILSSSSACASSLTAALSCKIRLKSIRENLTTHTLKRTETAMMRNTVPVNVAIFFLIVSACQNCFILFLTLVFPMPLCSLYNAAKAKP